MLSQTWRNIEIIVVDDGSTDESREVLKKYEGRIKIILKENGGQASAFNVGFAAASGEIICFLDSDDFWYPEKVEKIIKKYREAPWGLVCHHLSEVDATGNVINKLNDAQTVKTNLISCNLDDWLLKYNLSWVFSSTSGMSLPMKLANKIFPLPEPEWRICADNPIATSSLCHAPVGVIDQQLGGYRYHHLNLFASGRHHRIDTYIFNMEIKVKRFLFLH